MEDQEPLVSAEEVASVLAKDERRVGDDEPADDSGTYSLRRPVAIAPEAEPFARTRIERIAGWTFEVLSKELEKEIEVDLQGFKQQQMSMAIDSMVAPTWALSFVLENAGGMALILEPACALTVVEMALGGHGNSQAKGREPTPLESRVMRNLGTALIPGLKSKTSIPITDCRFAVGSVPTQLAARGEMVGAALLGLKIGELELSAMLVVTAGLLKPAAEASPSRTAQSAAMAARLNRVPVEARPVLPAGRVSLQNLISLEPGSILQLDAPEDRPIELCMAGQALFRGHIVRHDTGAEYHVDWRRGTRPVAGDAVALAAAPAAQEKRG